MTAFGPGDWVECVDDGARDGYPPPPHLYRGSVWVVERVFLDVGDVIVCRLQSYPHHLIDNHAGWNINRFRPIYRPKADLIERLMQPVPDEPVKVKA